MPDAITLRDSINLPENAVYARVSGGNGGFALIADSKFYSVKLALNNIREFFLL